MLLEYFWKNKLPSLKLRLPPLGSPIPIPKVDEETEEEQMKKVRRRKGLERSFITGSLRPASKRNTILGG